MSKVKVWEPCAEMQRPDVGGFYLDTSKNRFHLERIMRKGDVAYASRPDKPGTYCFREGKAISSLRAASGWMDTSGLNGQEIADSLEDIREAAVEAGILGINEVLPGTGSLAKSLLSRFTARTRQDEPGVLRILSREGIHQGPMLLTRASIQDGRAFLWDRSQAFLHGLYQPVGIEWDVRTPPACGESYLTRLLDKCSVGLAHLELEAPEQHIPQLPVSTMYGSVYGYGHIRGTWTFAQIRQAMATGYRIVLVHATAHAVRTEKVYAKMADFISAIPHKPLRKGLYRTAWGTLAGGGGIEGRKDNGGTGVRMCGSSLFWTEKAAVDPWQEEGVSYLFRPSHAAEIAGANHVVIQKVLEDFGPRVIQVLLDSVTVIGEETPGHAEWKQEAAGNFRGYSTGNYQFGIDNEITRERAMGKPDNMEFDRWVRELRAPMDRDWNNIPARSPEAVSTAMKMNEGMWKDCWDDCEREERPALKKPLTALPEGAR